MTPSRPFKLLLLCALYFAQGLPYGFFVQALPVLLREQKLTLGEIGLTSLLALPWAAKPLWAPLVDRWWSTRLGRRRSWLLPLQGLAAVTVGCLALVDVTAPEQRVLLYGAVLFTNLLAATQDIATDGLAVSLLTPEERGLGNGVQVGGYRLGMVTGGGVLLMAGAAIGTQATFGLMAALLALTMAPTWLLREGDLPGAEAGLSAPDAEAPAPPVGFFRRPGAWRVVGVVVTYKFGEAAAGAVFRPMLVDHGLGMADVGETLGLAGFTAALLGALVGGVLMRPLGRRRALLVFGLLQVATTAGYALLAPEGPVAAAQVADGALRSSSSLITFVLVESFLGSLATVALFTCMMDWSDPRTGGTDYTLQASLVVVSSGVAMSLSGFAADAFGYGATYLGAAGLALAGLAVAAYAFPKRPPHLA